MEIDLVNKGLSNTEKIEIGKLLDRENTDISDDLEQLWYLVDLIWDDFKCNNQALNWDNIGLFYSHPVWLLNGLYIEQDEMSMRHRHTISDWVIKNKFIKVVDYGGGFGTLARLVAEKDESILVDIYEPHFSEFGIKRAAQFQNINLIDNLEDQYDCLLCTDVLEHVSDPLSDFSKMIDSVNLGGYLVIANCFYPVVQCHLPQNFHFRYTFNFFARMMGLEVDGMFDGSVATIFRKKEDKQISWNVIRLMEIMSKISFSLISFLLPVLRIIKKGFK